MTGWFNRERGLVDRGVQEYPDALVYALDGSADRSLQYLWSVNDEILLVLDQNMRPRGPVMVRGVSC
jgi:hypothetical protein